MDAAEMLRTARRRAGLSQRELHDRTGVAQPTIARIESGLAVPRVDTLDRLLEACGEHLVTTRTLSRADKDQADQEDLLERLRAMPPARRHELLLILDETQGARAATTRKGRTAKR